MIKNIIFCLTFFCLINSCWAQIDSAALKKSEWKKLLQSHKFSVTKNKYKIPLDILKQIDADTITDITRSIFKWQSGCFGREPSVKLNWAATDKQNWIICYTIGGYSIKTYYQFISTDNKIDDEIMVSGFRYFRFKLFKRKFISDKLTDQKVIRARY
ncbi:MAG: hypothetical protein ACXVPU_18590 [Bacteroidia bacterium]